MVRLTREGNEITHKRDESKTVARQLAPMIYQLHSREQWQLHEERRRKETDSRRGRGGSNTSEVKGGGGGADQRSSRVA